MSARTEPRFTRGADLAVLVAGDRDAEALVRGALRRIAPIMRRGHRRQA
jgi:hypothetical protein